MLEFYDAEICFPVLLRTNIYRRVCQKEENSIKSAYPLEKIKVVICANDVCEELFIFSDCAFLKGYDCRGKKEFKKVEHFDYSYFYPYRKIKIGKNKFKDYKNIIINQIKRDSFYNNERNIQEEFNKIKIFFNIKDNEFKEISL